MMLWWPHERTEVISAIERSLTSFTSCRRHRSQHFSQICMNERQCVALIKPMSVAFALLITGAHAVHVRDLKTRDVMPVARLLRRSFSGDANPVSAAIIAAENAMSIQERMKDNILLVACEAKGVPVGFVEMLVPEWLASEAALAYPERIRNAMRPSIFSLAVDPTWRARGVATALMHSIEQRALTLGHSHLTLEVEESNEAALALYNKLGFRFVRSDEGRKLVGDLVFGRSVAVTKLSFEKELLAGANRGQGG